MSRTTPPGSRPVRDPASANGDNQRLILSGLILGLALSALEVTVVATAMPDVIAELGGQHLYSLPFALYMLMSTVSSPLWGYATDMYGRRRLYMAAVMLFLLGSALSGAADSMLWLVAARALQGLGGGGLMTLTFTIVGELYPLNERTKVQGYLSAVWGVAALVGPLIGGFIVDNVSWRWVFYLNLPFGLAGAALVYRFYQDQLRQKAVRLDLLGALIFTVGASLLVYGMETSSLPLLLSGLLVLLAFPFYELRQPVPLVPLRLLGDAQMLRIVVSNLLAGMAFFGMTAYLPLFFQVAREESATVAGALLSPTTVGWTIGSLVGARLTARLGLRWVARIGAMLIVLGFVLLTLTLNAPLWMPGAAGLVAGLGMGGVILSTLLAAQEEAPRALLGSITSILLFARSVGGSLGAALMGALLGDALQDGPQLGQLFWRVPGSSILLAVGMLVVLLRMREVRAAGAQAGQGEQNKQAEQVEAF